MKPTELPFHNLYRHGFVRVAVAVPRVRVADPGFNADATLALWRDASDAGARVVLFPELGLSAYTCDDLFHQHALLDACETALLRLLQQAAALPALAVVGLPLRVGGLLFNVAAVLHRGKVLGVLPKTYLPNHGEFYEARQFHGAADALATEVSLAGQTVPFGGELLFAATNLPDLVLHAELCEDLWAPLPPSTLAALAGATVLLNLSASNITVGKSAYRHDLVAGQSARCLAAYLYASAGMGESSTDMAWDGQALVAENGVMLAESARFDSDGHWVSADIDLERLQHERMRQTSFGHCAREHRERLLRWRRIGFELELPGAARLPLRRTVERHPYVPADPARRDERCHEVYDIQAQALRQRLAASGIGKLVIGVSGGLDSTHALLVCARALDELGRPRSDLIAVTLPGYATSDRTLDQARRLMAAVGCTALEIDIRPSCQQMLRDLGHPAADGQPQYDITYENVQAGQRTSHLFRLANHHGGLVIGTGDLSELALGWCTYGVGDHMAHYNVNASVPKTLIRHLVRWVAETQVAGTPTAGVLLDILATEISPELVPGDADGQPAQSTEAAIGPYELHDFSLYHVLRFGFAPPKVAFLAHHAWADVNAGAWPEGEHVQRRAFDLAQIRQHLRTFAHRFFKTSQFKRSVAPNSPKVGSGGSLSPRGDWRAPSDGEAAVWLAEVDHIPSDPA